MHRMNLPLRFFLAGSALAALLAAIALVFLDREQCPADYTQAQVDAAGCVVGANIGLGLMLFLAAVVWGCTALTALILFVIRRKRRPQR